MFVPSRRSPSPPAMFSPRPGSIFCDPFSEVDGEFSQLDSKRELYGKTPEINPKKVRKGSDKDQKSRSNENSKEKSQETSKEKTEKPPKRNKKKGSKSKSSSSSSSEKKEKNKEKVKSAEMVEGRRDTNTKVSFSPLLHRVYDQSIQVPYQSITLPSGAQSRQIGRGFDSPPELPFCEGSSLAVWIRLFGRRTRTKV